jgi:transposase-like protein
MTNTIIPAAPSFCPNPKCPHHLNCPRGHRFVRDGWYRRDAEPTRIQRYRCSHCRRRFSQQTFRVSYWLRRPDLPGLIFRRLLGCSCYRQIARELGVSPSTVMNQAARLGRHGLLFHQRQRPCGPPVEPLVLDGFVSFEYSQYHPTEFHVAIGAHSHFVYGFTDSELRRSGRMTPGQKRRRAWLERTWGRPDPRSREREVAALLRIVARAAPEFELWTDEHTDYPRALRRLGPVRVRHRVTSSRAARTARNPLFAVNLWDLLVRHSGANHKRETIAFSKRRQSAAERMVVLMVWRNWVKSFSERRRDGSPAMRLGLATRRWTIEDLLDERLFPSRIELPERWAEYYWRRIRTRRIPNATEHRRRYAA